MSTLKETCSACGNFLERVKPLTDLYETEDLGKILYSALMHKERGDGLRGFGPRDIWNTSNEELILLLKKLEEDIQSQSKSS